MPDAALIWFRQDLRLADNSVLAAVEGRPVLPVYILEEGPARPGAAARWWLHHSLVALSRALAARGAPLLILRGDPRRLIPDLAARIGATEVHAGRQSEPLARSRDADTHAALQQAGRRLVLHRNALLHEPHLLRSGSGTPFAVFTPFSRAVFEQLEGLPSPLPAPDHLTAAPGAPAGLSVEALGLLPRRDWADAFPEHWTPGEEGAAARLATFLDRGLATYAARRDVPAADWGTSGLSPHLHLGEISPRQVWHAAKAQGGAGLTTFLKEVLWREFSHHLLWHRPEMVDQPLRPAFAAFPWQPDARLLAAWQRGRTGVPMVDAGMRQLWRIGWMHNRVRMIAASYLVKHLLQPWQDGEAWFRDTLVDADIAANAASWQWVAGCGADAAPYFRIFNPVLQGAKFDPDGAYIRRWCPELARLPDRHIHAPHEAPDAVLRAAGIVIGRDYPAPIVDLAAGRARALDAFAAIKATEAA